MEAAQPPTESEPATTVAASLVGEASRKAGLVWLAYAGAASPRPAWHVWVEGAAYVVTGGAEQDLPGLADATEVMVDRPEQGHPGACGHLGRPRRDRGGR